MIYVVDGPLILLMQRVGVLIFHFLLRFTNHQRDLWGRALSCRLEEIASPTMSVLAEKGFNYSTLDQAFIVQKKNHFQVSIDLKMPDPATVRFVKTSGGILHQVSHFQINFYGVKSDSLDTIIKVQRIC